MEVGEILGLVFRWLHILAATVLVGGTIFLRMTIVPARRMGEMQEETFDFVRKRWARLVMLAILFSLVGGLYNAAMKAIEYQLDHVYLGMLALKIVLGLFVYFMISVLAGRSEMANSFREAEAKWYNITMVSVILLVLVAGYMKLSPQEIKVKDGDSDESVSQIDSISTASILDQIT